MAFLVQLTDDATRDLEDICDYIDRHDVPGRGGLCAGADRKGFQQPIRVSRARELPDGIAGHWDSEYREIFFRPYRIIYRVMESNVYVLLDRR